MPSFDGFSTYVQWCLDHGPTPPRRLAHKLRRSVLWFLRIDHLHIRFSRLEALIMDQNRRIEGLLHELKAAKEHHNG